MYTVTVDAHECSYYTCTDCPIHGVTKHYKHVDSQTYFCLLLSANLILHMHIDTHSFKKLCNCVAHIYTTEAANYVKITFTVP